MSPPSVSALPLSVNAPAVPANVIPLNVDPAVKSLTLVRPAAPSKISESAPGTGAMLPAQFSGLVQLVLAASAPVQVGVAADATDTAASPAAADNAINERALRRFDDVLISDEKRTVPVADKRD